MDSVGLIGCGNIGGRVAQVLVRKGFAVCACDADPARAAAVAFGYIKYVSNPSKLWLSKPEKTCLL